MNLSKTEEEEKRSTKKKQLSVAFAFLGSSASCSHSTLSASRLKMPGVSDGQATNCKHCTQFEERSTKFLQRAGTSPSFARCPQAMRPNCGSLEKSKVPTIQDVHEQGGSPVFLSSAAGGCRRKRLPSTRRPQQNAAILNNLHGINLSAPYCL